jgi:hypothetical protein
MRLVQRTGVRPRAADWLEPAQRAHLLVQFAFSIQMPLLVQRWWHAALQHAVFIPPVWQCFPCTAFVHTVDNKYSQWFPLQAYCSSALAPLSPQQALC